jgi:hypothetical protein
MLCGVRTDWASRFFGSPAFWVSESPCDPLVDERKREACFFLGRPQPERSSVVAQGRRIETGAAPIATSPS